MERQTPIEIWRDGEHVFTASRIELPDGDRMEVYDAEGDEVTEFDPEGDLTFYGAAVDAPLSRAAITAHVETLTAQIEADLRAGRIEQGEDAIVNAFDNSELLKDRPFDVVAAMTDDEQKNALLHIETHDYRFSEFGTAKKLVSLIAAIGIEKMINTIIAEGE